MLLTIQFIPTNLVFQHFPFLQAVLRAHLVQLGLLLQHHLVYQRVLTLLCHLGFLQVLLDHVHPVVLVPLLHQLAHLVQMVQKVQSLLRS